MTSSVKGWTWKAKHSSKIGRELIFIAHSSGGIIVKQALVIALNSSKSTYRKILDSTLGAVFLSMPHSTRAEDMIEVLQYAIFARGVRVETDIPELLRQSVASLQAIQQTFEELHLRKLLSIQIASFFEELSVPGFGLVIDSKPPEIGISDRYRLSTNHRWCPGTFLLYTCTQITR